MLFRSVSQSRYGVDDIDDTDAYFYDFNEDDDDDGTDDQGAANADDRVH